MSLTQSAYNFNSKSFNLNPESANKSLAPLRCRAGGVEHKLVRGSGNLGAATKKSK